MSWHVSRRRSTIWKLSSALSALDANISITLIDGRDHWWEESDHVSPIKTTPLYSPAIELRMRTLCDADTQAYTPPVYKAKVADLSSLESKGGITIARSCTRIHSASIGVRYVFDRTSWKHTAALTTVNVCQLRFNRPAGLDGSPGGSAFDWENTSSIAIDGDVLGTTAGLYADDAFLCKTCAAGSALPAAVAGGSGSAGCGWALCDQQRAHAKGPLSGMAGVLAAPVTIVYGSTGYDGKDASFNQLIAAFLATELARKRLIAVSVVSDTDSEASAVELRRSRNLIIIGTPDDNRLLQLHQYRSVVSSLWPNAEGCQEPLARGRDTGLLAVVPSPLAPARHSAVVLSSCSAQTLLRVAQVFRRAGDDLPDYTVFGGDVAARGWLAVQAMGHWTEDWQVDPALSGSPA